MNIPDLANGLFEFFGGISVLTNIAAVRKAKQVRGVYGLASFYYLAWGLFNMYFYPHLGQWWSFSGGLFIAAGNAVWLFYYLKYRKN